MFVFRKFCSASKVFSAVFGWILFYSFALTWVLGGVLDCFYVRGNLNECFFFLVFTCWINYSNSFMRHSKPSNFKETTCFNQIFTYSNSHHHETLNKFSTVKLIKLCCLFNLATLWTKLVNLFIKSIGFNWILINIPLISAESNYSITTITIENEKYIHWLQLA